MENEIVKILLAVLRLSKDMAKMSVDLEKVAELLQSEEFLKSIAICKPLSKEDYD